MRPSQAALLAIALAGCACLETGCGSTHAANSIVVYSGQHEQTTHALAAAFEHQSGIRVEVRSGDEASLGNQVLQEGSASPADVFYSENTPVLEVLAHHGLLAPVAPSTLAAVPARLSSAEGRWVGVSARTSAIVYNTALIKPAELPRSLSELAAARYRGKVAFAPSETDFQPLVSAIIRRDGAAAAEAWLKGLQANGRSYSDNETILREVNEGQSALAPVNSYYWYRLRDELGAKGTHSAVAYFTPGDVGSLIDISGAAVLRSSSNSVGAQRFLAFLVSAEGQALIAHSKSYEYPLRPGIAAAPGLPALASLHPVALSPAQLGEGREALELEQKLGLL